MPKKCILCDKEAEYCIKGSSETYCKECAIEQFQDVDYLQKIEEVQTKKVNEILSDKIEEGADIDDYGEDLGEEE